MESGEGEKKSNPIEEAAKFSSTSLSKCKICNVSLLA
jgi:hypothetical protein